MKILKRSLIILGILFGLFIVSGVILFTSMKNDVETYNNFDYSTIDLSAVEDGTYLGTEESVLVKVSVKVVVKDHTIRNVIILSHQCGQGRPAEKIVSDIVSQNSLDVDVVSGATVSSNVIKMAVYQALAK